MIAATGWDVQAREAATLADVVPLVDPCCGSGTVCIEAAQIALHIAPGGQRRFAFEKLLPYQPHVWYALHDEARQAERPWPEGQGPIVFGSDVAFRMVDFSQRNAERAHVGQAIEFRGGDALQRLPPTPRPGVLLLNPPYGERIAAAGVAGRNAAERARTHTIGREEARSDDGFAADAFFERLAAHWKSHYAGWTAWLLTPDLKLPGRMRLKESRRVPLWNGPIECRLFRFDLTARNPRPAATEA
jgi:putative N6-adenine-specific DNA methylase